MYDTTETFEHNGYTVKVMYDPDPIDPRGDFDHLGTMVCWHQRYDLGDETVPIPHGPDELAELIPDDAVVWLPLYLYEHGSMTMQAGGPGAGPDSNPFRDRWDSGMVGVIFTTPADLIEAGHKSDALPSAGQVAEWLSGEVEEYDQFLTGQVYGFTIEDADGDTVESCWGFYGEDYCIEEARASVPDEPSVRTVDRLRMRMGRPDTAPFEFERARDVAPAVAEALAVLLSSDTVVQVAVTDDAGWVREYRLAEGAVAGVVM